MPWTHPPLAVFHGCDDVAANDILTYGIQLARCRVRTDFGKGFYTTTSLHQAKNWADMRIRRQHGAGRKATVLKFTIDRNQLAKLAVLAFVYEGTAPGADFWEFVRHCRSGTSSHGLIPSGRYDVVFGLVTLWPQTLVLKDCDQISIHTDRAVGQLKSGSIYSQTRSSTGLF